MRVKHRTAAVYIGRFQPFHAGHEMVLLRALRKYDDVVVVIGSSTSPRSARNPWTAAEREQMIRDSTRAHGYNNVRFHYQPDTTDWTVSPQGRVDLAWAGQVVVNVLHKLNDYRGDRTISIVGANKDESTYYLDLFPQWKQDLTSGTNTSGTNIRKQYFTRGRRMSWQQLPYGTRALLWAFRKSPCYWTIPRRIWYIL